MSERPPGLDDLLGYVADNLPVFVPPCEHRGDTWFDRQLCAQPCGAMHDRCVACGEAVDSCVLQEDADRSEED